MTLPRRVSGDAAVDAPKIWDPLSAALLSYLFSISFGAVLVARNWLELGEKKRAQWSYAVAGANVLLVLTQIMLWPHVNHFLDLCLFTTLVGTWYFFDARQQIARLSLTAQISPRPWPRVVCYGILFVVILYLTDYLLAHHSSS